MDNVLWSLGQELKLNVVKSENCALTNFDGKTYIDLESGIWSASIGHSHPEILEVIKTQSQKVIHTGYCYTDPIVNECSETILDLLSFKKGKCGFLCAGSESVVMGVRILQALNKDKLILCFSNGYFGSYGDARDKRDDTWFKFDWMVNCKNCSRECETCEYFKGIPFEKIAAFVFEPGSSDFIKFPPERPVGKIVEKIKENNGFVLSNEVTTGLGRTGKWFGFEHYNIAPDIVCFGKSIGNGYPVSVVAVNEKVSSLLDREAFYYCQSHGNDALGASIAKKVIEIMKRDGLVEKSYSKGSYLIEKLRKIALKSSLIKEVRGRGLMIAIEFVSDSSDPAHEISKKLFSKGFVVSNLKNMGHIRIDPAYTIEEKHMDDFIDSFETIIESFE